MKYICVYCASSPPCDERLYDVTRRVAEVIATNGYGLVYGGASVGLMGTLARRVMECGSRVCGVIPYILQKRELNELPLHEVCRVRTMSERKEMMAAKACAFVALPGGIGTLDELCECLDWSHLGQHRCPVILYNAFGYYDKLLEFFDQAVLAGFMSEDFRNSIHTVTQAEDIMRVIANYIPPTLPDWVTLDESDEQG